MKIGVDIVDVVRMEKFIQNERFLNKYFTDYEIKYVHKKDRSSRSTQALAGIYAAKEAFLKALGIGIGGGIDLNEIEVNHTKLGKPIIRVITPKAQIVLTKLEVTNIDVSISHTDEVCIANCLIEDRLEEKSEQNTEETVEE